MTGGMQTSGIKTMYCHCGKETSKTMRFGDTRQGIGKDISIHFGKNKTYWCIYENWKIRRTYKKPKGWE